MKKFLLALCFISSFSFAELYYDNINNIYYCGNVGTKKIDQAQYNLLFKYILKNKIMCNTTTYQICYYLTLIGTETSLQLLTDMKQFVDLMCGGHCNSQNWTDFICTNYVLSSDYR